MSMSRIQFQPGLSMPDFFIQYGSEAQCATVLEKTRRPNGFQCPSCGDMAHYVLRGGSCKVFQYDACRHQTSFIAGTAFQGTKLRLMVWLLAICLINQAKVGLFALALERQLGLSYPTAKLINYKLIFQAIAQ